MVEITPHGCLILTALCARQDGLSSEELLEVQREWSIEVERFFETLQHLLDATFVIRVARPAEYAYKITTAGVRYLTGRTIIPRRAIA